MGGQKLKDITYKEQRSWNRCLDQHKLAPQAVQPARKGGGGWGEDIHAPCRPWQH